MRPAQRHLPWVCCRVRPPHREPYGAAGTPGSSATGAAAGSQPGRRPRPMGTHTCPSELPICFQVALFLPDRIQDPPATRQAASDPPKGAARACSAGAAYLCLPDAAGTLGHVSKCCCVAVTRAERRNSCALAQTISSKCGVMSPQHAPKAAETNWNQSKAHT